MVRVTVVVSFLLTLTACTPASEAEPAPPAAATRMAVTQLRFPFAGDTVNPSVVSDGANGFLLAWTDKKAQTLNLAAYRDGRWFQPRMIAHGDLLTGHANFPSVAAGPRGVLFAQWVERHAHGSTVRIARSRDGGATWSAPVTPHPDVVSAFGFVSLAPNADGSADAIWLDGRGLEGGVEGHGDMQLHAARIDARGQLASEQLVDARVCDCCQTSMASTPNGAVAVYRDRSPKEIRDIGIVRRTANGWSQPTLLHADGWQIPGCPVNGPQIAASGDDVAVAWYTGAKNQPRVNVAFSSNGGASFAAPVRIDGGHPAGHVAIAMLPDRSALVTWLEEASGKVQLLARRVRAGGVTEAPTLVAEAASAHAAGYPRIAVSKENVAVVWNGDGPQPSVRLAMISLSNRR
jgi:hypothetical protein